MLIVIGNGQLRGAFFCWCPAASSPRFSYLRLYCERGGVRDLQSRTDGRLSLPRPPRGWRMARRNLGGAQRHEMAPLVRIAAPLRAVLAAHVAFQLMDWRRLWPPHDVERDCLMCVAAEAFHFEIEVTGVERVAERRGWLRGSLKAEHAFIPRFAGGPFRFLERLS